tara:strand:+ start:1669 stop:2085 length:417 start_codon:yes stop_codon:yes gene_type:complete
MGRVLGVDYGESRVGLALSDPNKIIASPFCTISYKDKKFLKDKLEDIILERNIDCLVIGLPIGLKGKDTKQTKVVKLFAKTIENLNLPIYFQDERFSSFSAQKALIAQNIKTGHNKDLIDSTAAAIFLQQFLDSNKLQ